MTQKTAKQVDTGLRLIVAQDCEVGDWIHNSTADETLHGFWHKCIGVRPADGTIDIWLEMDRFEETELHHVNSDDTIVVCSIDPRESVDHG